MTGKPSVDVYISDEGSVVAFRPMTREARQWFSEFVQAESWQWIGPYLCVDHRYADDLAGGLTDEGFNVAFE